MCHWCLVCIGSFRWFPLVGSCWTFGQFPFIIEKNPKIIVVPSIWNGCPGSFQAAGNGVVSKPGFKSTYPAFSHVFHSCALWLGAHIFFGIACTVGFSEGMSASNQRNGFVIVHCHSTKSFTNIVG